MICFHLLAARIQLTEKVKEYLLLGLLILFVLGIVAGAVFVGLRYFGPKGPVAEIKEDYEERLKQELEKDRAKIKKLEEDLATVRKEQIILKEVIIESIRLREEDYEAINSASSIDDIDAIIRRGESRGTWQD